MTNKQLEALNVKIAKKLGWKRFRMERTPEPLNTRRMTGLAPGNLRNQFVPAFTNNLAYALQLVDWANEHGYYFELVKSATMKSYEVMFRKFDSEFVDLGTLPSMAICMAFLKIK